MQVNTPMSLSPLFSHSPAFFLFKPLRYPGPVPSLLLLLSVFLCLGCYENSCAMAAETPPRTASSVPADGKNLTEDNAAVAPSFQTMLNKVAFGAMRLRLEFQLQRAASLAAHAPFFRFLPGRLDTAWEPLLERLATDGFDRREMEGLFASLGPESYTPAFMAAKIFELHGVPGIGIRRDTVPSPEPPPGFVPLVPDITVGSCLEFMTAYADAIADIEERHGVRADTILAVLLVETGLGLVTGDDIALRSLASMAATDTPERLGSHKNSGQAKRLNARTLAATLKTKSDWAYKEVKALIAYGKEQNIDISRLPGSIYGAVGLCQFMPSNIAPLAVDGDRDGKIDLFSPVDAMYSVANYLESNGWRAAKTEGQRSAVIRTYNNDGYYVSCVLGSSGILARERGKSVSQKQRHGQHRLCPLRQTGPQLAPYPLRAAKSQGGIPRKLPGPDAITAIPQAKKMTGGEVALPPVASFKKSFIPQSASSSPDIRRVLPQNPCYCRQTSPQASVGCPCCRCCAPRRYLAAPPLPGKRPPG